ncbi:MAG: pyridoxine 5'-phosphate synthase [Epsilonproteobacteria bacterium]|nr:pyridoxine 5'-phosphate synthase [Campylobacterota bacterium]
MRLGVNIDHIATLREARAINEPDPLMALEICKRAGADQITIHLREDRRHIDDFDAQRIIQSSFLPVNVECSINQEIVEIISSLKPHRVTLVPENRAEVTTEGGLDLFKNTTQIQRAIETFLSNDISVSLFIDPDIAQIEKSKILGADMIELHTGKYANLSLALNSNINATKHKLFPTLSRAQLKELLTEQIQLLQNSALFAKDIGIEVAAGHGLNYQNVHEIAQIPEIVELNIGHSIIANSIFMGLADAIRLMREIITKRELRM